MGSKNHPPKYDCYANAAPDEEMFILLGRDPMAGAVVRVWVMLREREGTITADKAAEARAVADKLDAWAVQLGKSERVARAPSLLTTVLAELAEKTS